MKAGVVLAPAWSPGTIIDWAFGMALASRPGSGERVSSSPAITSVVV